MISPIYDILLSLQNALGGSVTPQLRAVTVDIDMKNHELLPCFFYDGEITEEISDLYSVLLTEIDTNTAENYFCREKILKLASPEKIPIRGKLAYLRYEPTLPMFEKEDRAFLLKEGFPFHAVFRLDMQEALLGKITPALRHVSVGIDPDKKKLTAHFIYDGEISEKNFKLATAAIQESRGTFSGYNMDSFIERVDFPNEMSHRGNWLAYWRQETLNSSSMKR
jgi:hypothetical protein